MARIPKPRDPVPSGILTALRWGSGRYAGWIIKDLEEDLGEQHVPHDLACFILDLNGMVSWILAVGGEHINETLGSAQRSKAGRLHIGEVEPECVIAPTMAGAANVNEEARHGGCKG